MQPVDTQRRPGGPDDERGYPPPGYGVRRPSGEQAGPGDGPGLPRAADAVAGPKLARTRRIVLTAFLVELVVVAATANQAVARHGQAFADRRAGTFLGRAVQSWQTFSWRFTPAADGVGAQHRLYGQWLLLGVLVVLSALLSTAVVRGPITFARAFFGVWTAVVVAGAAGVVASLFVTRGGRSPDLSPAVYAMTQGVPVASLFAGAVLGFVVALVTAVVAVTGRRPTTIDLVAVPASAPLPVPQAPPPYYGPAGSLAPPIPTDQPTAAFPLPPDDEALGHHPEHD